LRTFTLSVVALLTMAVSALAAQDLKIGFVHVQRIWKESAPAQRAGKKIDKEFAPRDNEIRKMEKQAQDIRGQLDKDGVTMAEADRRNKERDLANLARDIERTRREAREDFNLRRNEEFAAVQEVAEKVIAEIAKAEKFDLIVNEGVLYASPKIDITDRVLKALADK
jgi:outer membrane protein